MNRDEDLFSSVQQHIQGSKSVADAPYSDPMAYDTESVYRLEHAHDGVYETGVMQPTRTGAYDVGQVYAQQPYLRASPPGAQSMTSIPPYSPSRYVNTWGESEAELPLTKHGSTMNFAEDEFDEARQLDQPIYSEQSHKPSLLSNWMGTSSRQEPYVAGNEHSGKFTWSNPELLQRQIDQRQRGVGRQSWPIVSWFLAYVHSFVDLHRLGMVGAFIAELIIAKETTGQAIQTHPQVQPMLGPSVEFLISFGARFVPCMRSVPGLPATNKLPCLEYTTSSTNEFTDSQLCPLSQICGLSDAQNPDQSWRFVSAIVRQLTDTSSCTLASSVRVSAHPDIIFNLLVLLTLCCQIEKLIGSVAYTVVFMAGGIGGNLLGGNFGLIGQPALGASGSIYTCISLEIIDLIYNWKYVRMPRLTQENRARTRIVVSIIFAVIGLGLGLLPGIDNFSHIGGFCIGVLGGMFFAPSIHATRAHMVGTWVLRLIGIGLLIAFFVALSLNFYRSTDPRQACRWCRYLSCLPVFDSCKGFGITTTNADGENVSP